MDAEKIYLDGEYWKSNAGFHESDADFKFANCLRLIKRNNITFEKIIDIGCGSGKLIYNFSNYFPSNKCIGVDLDPGIISYASGKFKNENLVFQEGQYKEFNENDLFTVCDVFEHVPDYLSFIEQFKSSKYVIFNVPCDISVRSLLFNGAGAIKAYDAVHHVHFFYDNLILHILNDRGLKVVDYLYSDNPKIFYQNNKTFKMGLLYFGTKFFSLIFGKKIVNKFLGVYSFTILCQPEI